MIALSSGDSIRGDASVASQVDYTLSGIVAVEVTHLASGQLASSEGTLFTASGHGAAVTAICIVNTDSSARTLNLYHKPSGGTSRRIVPKDISLAAGYCMYANGVEIKVLDTSGNEQMSAIALDDTPVDGAVTEAITSNWAYDHNAAKTAVHGAGGNDLINTGDVDDTPIDGATTAPVSSNWAFDTEAKLDDCAQTVQSYSLDNVYTNGTKIRVVVVTVYGTSANSWTAIVAYCDNTDGATTVVAASAGRVSSGANPPYQTVIFVVPPAYKYQVTTHADNETLYKWTEWDLL